MRPPPIVRWTGSYGLVQADRPRTSPIATTQGIIRGLVISVFSNVLLDWPFAAFRRLINSPPQNAAQQTNIPTIGTPLCDHCVSFLDPARATAPEARN